MTKVARTFTIDIEVYEAAKKSLPNMSEVVENGLRDAVESNKGGESPFLGITKQLFKKAIDRVSSSPGNERIANFQAEEINRACKTTVTGHELQQYVEQNCIMR